MELLFIVPSGCIRLSGTTVLVTYAGITNGKLILIMFYVCSKDSVRFLAFFFVYINKQFIERIGKTTPKSIQDLYTKGPEDYKQLHIRKKHLFNS